MASTVNRIIKNSVFLYARLAITMFISLYTTRLILNSLGASDFGVFNVLGGAIAMLGFLNAAMASATQRFMSYSEGSGDKENQRVIFNVSLILHVFIACLAGLLFLLFGYFFFHGLLNIPSERYFAAKIVYGSLIVSTMFTVMTVPYDAVMNAHENFKYYAIIGIFESLLKLSVAFVCVYSLYDKLIIYGLLMGGIPLVTLSIMRIYCHRRYTECVVQPRKYWDKNILHSMTSFAGWNLLGNSSTMIGNYGNAIVVNHFFGAVINASMGIVSQLQGQLLVLTNNMLKVLIPVIIKKEGANQRDEMLKWSLEGCRFSYLLLVWIAIPFCVEAPFILKMWLKDVPEWTVLFLRLQVVRTLLELTTQSFSTSLDATGKIKEVNLITAILFFSPLILEWVMFGIGFRAYWMYILMIIVVIIQNLVRITLCKKYCGLNISLYVKDFLLPMLLFTIELIVIAILPSLFMSIGWGRAILSVSLSIVVFLVSGYVYILHEDEKNIVNKLLVKIYKPLSPYFKNSDNL